MKITNKNGLREYGEENNCLNIILSKLFPNNIFLHNKILTIDKQVLRTKVGTIIKPDYVCHELKMIVEFDGDNILRRGHFSDVSINIMDKLKDDVYHEIGYKIIRIPPYVQLDSEMIKYYFDIDYLDDLYDTCHDHGFLHKDILLPGNFTIMAHERFTNDLTSFPDNVVLKINITLAYREFLLTEKGFGKEEAHLIVYGQRN